MSNFVEMFHFFANYKKSCDFPVSDGPTNEMKTRVFVEINLFIILLRVKSILRHCTKIPLKQLNIQKCFKGEFSKSIQRYSTKWKKVGTETINDLEQVCPKQEQDFISWLLSSETILPRLTLSSRSSICFINSSSRNECYRRTYVELKEFM